MHHQLIKKKYTYRLFLIFLLFTIVGCFNKNNSVKLPSKACKSNETFSIIFDQSKEQIYGPFGTTFDGLSSFSSSFLDSGFIFEFNNLDYKTLFNKYDNYLKQNIFFLGLSKFKTYTDKEINYLKKYVNDGGRLVIIVEHDNFFNSTVFQNKLLKEFGMYSRFDAVYGDSEKDSMPHWPLVTDELFNLKNIRFFLPSSLKFINQANIFSKVKYPQADGDFATFLYKKVGKGKVIVFSDMEIFWNMGGDIGVNYGDNLNYLLNSFSLLTQCTAKANDKNIINLKPSKQITNPRRVHFEFPWPKMILNASISGFSKFINYFKTNGFIVSIGQSKDINFYKKLDLAVVLDPLESKYINENVTHSKKILFLGDGQTNILKKEPELKKMLNEKFNLKVRKQEYPINKITRKFGFLFNQHTLIDDANKENALNIQSVWFKTKEDAFNGFRLCSISALPDKNFIVKNILTIAKKDTVAYTTITPQVTDGIPSLAQTLKVLDDPSYENYYVTSYLNNKIMAICDYDFLTNQHFKDEENISFINYLFDWIKD
jgi:hypothetical protein